MSCCLRAMFCGIWTVGDDVNAVLAAAPPVPMRMSVEAATNAGRSGELAFNSAVAGSFTWPSAHEISVDSRRLIVCWLA